MLSLGNKKAKSIYLMETVNENKEIYEAPQIEIIEIEIEQSILSASSPGGEGEYIPGDGDW